ncbi:8091_t:CDS:1, partial [Funneliformis geosporum]
IPGKADQLNILRQGDTDPHKDNVDCMNAFCAIVVFGDFEGGDLVLSEIGITIEIK